MSNGGTDSDNGTYGPVGASSGGNSGGGGGGSPGVETLDQARTHGDVFSGDVYWDNDNRIILGKASGEADQDYGQVFFDKAANLFVFDSTKDGAGTVRPMTWRMGGVDKMRLQASGALTIGATAVVGTELLRVSGDVYIDGKLTLIGPMDPPSVSLSGGTALFFDSANGITAPLSAVGHGRIRYNDTTKAWQMSMDGGLYQTIGSGAPGADAWVSTGNAFGGDAIFGLLDNHVIQIKVNNKEFGRLTDQGAFLPEIGPRLLIGDITSSFLFNSEIIAIERDIPDQCGMSIRNTNAVNIANSGYYLIDDTGAIGGFNILNSGWPADGSDTGVFPHEVALLTAGPDSNLVLGTLYPGNLIRFIVNDGGTPAFTAEEMGRMFLGPDFYTFSWDGLLLVESNIVTPASVFCSSAVIDVFLRVGTVASLLGVGDFIAGESGGHSLSFEDDAPNSSVYLKILGKTGRIAVHQIVSAGNVGGAGGLGSYFNIINSSGQTGYITLLETGAFESFVGQNGFMTLATTSGVGIRVNVNGVNDSGWELTSAGDLRFFAAKEGHFGVAPVSQQAAIPNAAGGAVIDAEARAALNALLASQRSYGFVAP